MPGAIRTDSQSFAPGNYVQMFDLDATSLGGGLFRFTNDVHPSGFTLWKGNTYLPLPIQAEGFEIAGKTTPNRPRLRVANVLNVLAAAMDTFGDLVGAKVTRWRTFAQYLDQGSAPDPNRYFPTELYRIDRLVSRNRVYAEWELSTPLDVEGAMLPARQCLREICSHRYRYYESGAFQYARVTCPYAGSTYFTDTDLPTANPALDACSFTLVGCRLRFGANAELPIQAFPAVARTRI